MAEHRFVLPIEKGLHTTHHIQVDAKSLLPAQPTGTDGVGERDSASWWNSVLDLPNRNISVFECVEVVDRLTCSELTLLKCSERCCMNWTIYDKTDCLASKDTSCDNLHQLSLYTTTLGCLERFIARLTNWPLHFIICESINTNTKENIKLNRLGAMIDSTNIILLNPNLFPIVLLLQEKIESCKARQSHLPKKRGRKMLNKLTGTCQMPIVMDPGKVACLTANTIKNWDVYSISNTNPNYMLCVMGRYDMSNWLIKKLLRGKEMGTFHPDCTPKAT